jgi:hypothetical protein
MRRDKFITVQTHNRDEPWITAAPLGRRFLHRNSAAQDNTWTVRNADSLLDVIYAEHRTGDAGHRPSVQAIGRLEDDALGELDEVLVGLGLLKTPDGPAAAATWLELTPAGIEHARTRWQESAPPGVWWLSVEHPPTPPLPYQRRLPLRISREDRVHPVDERYGNWCSQASWLQRSSKTKLFATLKRDGAVKWTGSRCTGSWLVYLQAFTATGAPAYADPGSGAYNRPLWRPTWRYD